MESPIHFIFFIILFACHVNICFNKDQRYNPNSDFLLHEAGALAPNNKNDYNTNFPSLPSSKLSTLSTVGPSVNSVATNKPQASGKRDYVAPQRPSINPTPITPPTPKLNPIPNSGSTSHLPKRNYVAPQFPTLKPVGTLQHQSGPYISSPNNKNEYNANFPSLPSSKPTTSSTLMPNGNSVATTKLQSSGKRDYVAPQRQSVNPTPMTPPTSKLNQVTNSGGPKRDYVAPQFPTLRPVGTSQHQSSAITTPMTPSSPKRDYVAPKNDRTQNVPGKVKDLINFYDSKSQGGIVPSKQPSYSSILHGSTSSASNGPNVLPSTIMTPAPPRKPAVTNNNNLSASRQGSTVLPSSIVNNQGQGINSNSPTDEELKTISEELLRKDVNNAAKYITVNYQEKTTSMSMDDKAPLPLLTIAPEVWNIPTVQKFVPLLDNYERDTLVNEHVTSQERTEENAFMDAIMTTSVIRHLMNFLKDKGYVTPDPKQQRDFLKQIWFGLYSRGKGKISSSGFEHIFVSELKNGEVSGLHNWVYFSKEEQANRANYLGYMKSVEFSDKGAVIKMHFNQQGVDKPVSTMFIGTSPELEMAIYTLCYVTRVDNDCNIKLGTKDVNILTHNFRYRSKNYIGSAYPQI